MKIVIQRVKCASVQVNGQIISQIGQGLLLFICLEVGDNLAKVDLAVKKISQLRIFEDKLTRKMGLNLQQVGGALLCVSQFTLSWNGTGGNRPSFDLSMEPQLALELFDSFCQKLKNLDIIVEKGLFGADMEVNIVNDGPVTFCLNW